MFQFGNFNMNMFNSNMLGMGSMFGANSFGLGGSSFLGSIWGSNISSSFMNCKGIVDYDSMALAGVGNFLTNFLLNTFSGYISSKKENSTDNIKNDINEMNSSIKDLNNKLINYQKDESTINNKISENDSNIQSKNKTITENTSKINTLKTDLETLKKKLETLEDTEDKTVIEKQIAEKNDEIKKLEEANKTLTSEIETLKKENETQKKELEKVQADINNVKVEINKFENYKKNAQKMLNNEILEKADGYKIQRTNQNDYDKLFKKGDNNAWSLPADYKTTKADVRFAILGYNKAPTEEEKKNYQEQFKLLWENLPIEDRTDSLRAAANIILG